MTDVAVDRTRYEVPVEQLRWHCDPALFQFRCTDEVAPLQEFIGQERALRALEFGLAVERPGYNIFVTGLTGTGKASAIQTYVRKAVEARKAEARRHLPHDWCYVYSFTDPDRPQYLQLPQGQGKALKAQLQELQSALRAQLAKVFGSDEYRAQAKAIAEEGQTRSRDLFRQLEEEAQRAGFFIQMSPTGLVILPLLQDRPMQPQEFMALESAERQAIEDRQAQFMPRVEQAMERVHAIERETGERVRALEQTAAENTMRPLFEVLVARYQEFPPVQRYLEGLRGFTREQVGWFLRDGKEQESSGQPPAPPRRDQDPGIAFQVNVLVDNSPVEGPPIVIEHHPTWSALFGKIERKAFMGTYVSDHSMLKAGALHLANGGYLILNARDVLLSPGTWEGLKRVLRTRTVRIEDPTEALGLVVPQGLQPESIPLDVTVIMTGDQMLYQLLSRAEEEFWEVFRVKADFDSQIERTPENLHSYAAFICGVCDDEQLLHFDPSGVARVAEHGARQVADQRKLSSRFGQIKELLVEAEYWARRTGHGLVTGEDVQKAIEEKVFRSSLMADRIRQLITEGTLMVDVAGAVVGQVNGLAVYDLGDISFGRPSRITARTFMGRRGVINIERESQLSGRIHDKGVLILSGYLGWKFAQDRPLTLSASVCFEQSYEGVEGDSASSTELYAILSSLSGRPIRQGIAVTGSVNQKGEIQPIGGANQKIEGFFDVCRAKGLTGEQGVIVPHQNLQNLMLREDVVEAVRGGQFCVYAVQTVDEGIEILTGVPAGERGPDGTYPEGTVSCLVDRRLGELAQGIKGFSAEPSEAT